MAPHDGASHPVTPPEPWPAEGLTRVPYWIFQREDIYAAEQARLFQGPVWSFLCLDVEVPGAGDFGISGDSFTSIEGKDARRAGWGSTHSIASQRRMR